jgi:hypothetical protein
MNRIKNILKATLILTAVLSVLAVSLFAADSKYKKLNKDGTANMVFSNTNIKKGEEGKSTLKTRFEDSESIYARAYFSSKFGQLKGEEEGFIDIWIDGKHAKRLAFSNKDIAPDKDQTLIYVYKTTDYSPDFKDDVWEDLSAGEHNIHLVVGKTKFMREGVSVQDQGDRYAIKRDDVHKAVYLSDATFTFVKN